MNKLIGNFFFWQNLQIFYTVDNPTKNWRGGAGYISKDVVVKGLPSPSDDTLILVSFALSSKTYIYYIVLTELL